MEKRPKQIVINVGIPFDHPIIISSEDNEPDKRPVSRSGAVGRSFTHKLPSMSKLGGSGRP